MKPARSAWSRGVRLYALEILEAVNDGRLDELGPMASRAAVQYVLLNGAENWKKASEGGSFLVYDGDIAKRLCTPTELRYTKNGERNPNRRESWLDVQARALAQAAMLIVAMYR